MTAPRSRGWRRMREIRAEDEAMRKAVETELLDGLGRRPSPLDRIAAEQLAASVVRARRLRALGRDDREERRQIVQMMRASNFKPEIAR